MDFDILNKYIYDAFLMIYLSIFVVAIAVVFSLFGASKYLIRDSQRLCFCKTVRESSR